MIDLERGARRAAALVIVFAAVAGCTRPGDIDGRIEKDLGQMTVSWYGGKWHGVRTASGERFDKNSMTAAHRTLPFGTRLLLVNPKNGKSVVVTVNNRGPHIKSRDLDVSEAAADALGFRQQGLAVLKAAQIKPDR